MKKTILFLLVLFSITSGSAQNFIKDITGVTGTYFVLNTTDIAIAKDKTIEIYNKDMELVKTISNLPKEFKSLHFASKNFFGLRNMYEFVIKKENNSIVTYELYNEEGYLFNFNQFSPYSLLGTRFITYKFNDETKNMDLKVYSVSGYNKEPDPEEPNSSSKGIKGNQNLVYPVPAKNEVNISYSINQMQEMQVFDISGKCVETVLLDPSQSVYQLNVSKYQPGNYIYKSLSFDGKFIVN